MPFNRREVLAGAAVALALTRVARADVGPSTGDEPGLVDSARAVAAKKITALAAVEAALARIDALDAHGPTLRAVLEVNPDARDIAKALDADLAKGKSKGALHGVPVVIKDNIDTADKMSTCAGSLALIGVKRAKDARVAALLRGAGAVIVGKANMSEWANYRSNIAVSGWSGRGGQCKNPYALDRNPSGSSSGSAVAVAAGLVPGAVGSETWGSIISPSSSNGVVGFKPSLGEISAKGIIPITAEQDTAGPIARSVADVALLFDVMRERGGRTSLDGATLKGKKIGVARSLAGFHPAVDALFEDALRALKAEGAVLVDPSPFAVPPGMTEADGVALSYEAKRDLEGYLKTLPATSPVRSIADVVRFNEQHAKDELALFGQELLVVADGRGALTTPEYLEARGKVRKLAEGALAAGLKDVDVVVGPTQGPAGLTDVVNGDFLLGGSSMAVPAMAGTPHLTVPMAFVRGLPVGLSFIGRARDDDEVLRIAFAYERATHARRPPRFLASVPG